MKILAYIFGGHYRVATIFEIPVIMSGGFLFFLVLIVTLPFLSFSPTQAVWAGLNSLSIISALWLCIMLHEFGHALTAQRLGYSVHEIIILPIGAVACIEEGWAADPRHEFKIAIAGPAVNGVLILLLASPLLVHYVEPFKGGWEGPLRQFIFLNALIGGFNLLPIFPLDGGRILRSTIARFEKNPLKAYDMAVYAGYGVAAAVCPLLWWFWHPIVAYILIFVIVFFSRGERRVVEAHALEKEMEEMVKTDIFAKEGAILASYKEQAEGLSEDERKEYLEKMDGFHSWMKLAFKTNCVISVELYKTEEERSKTAQQRWNRFVRTLARLEDWWVFYDNCVAVERHQQVKAIRRILIMTDNWQETIRKVKAGV